MSNRLELYLTMFSLMVRALSVKSFPACMRLTSMSGLEKTFFLWQFCPGVAMMVSNLGGASR